jgi:hypothetical protein
MFRLWQWFWQRIADKHFNKWMIKKDLNEIEKYNKAIKNKLLYR